MSKMKWSLKQDTTFGRKLLTWELWKYRSGTRELGNCLEEISKILNNIKDTQFCVSPKGLRDCLKILERDCKAKRGSVISHEYQEIDPIMEDYLERRDKEEAKQTKESAEDQTKEDQDKATGEEMRETAMERLAQTKMRNGKDKPEKINRKKTQ